jgi:hypothetical protein
MRWIGAPDAETPAPIVTVTKAAAAGGTSSTATPAASAKAGSSSDSGGASKGLGVTALIIGALGLIAGLAAFGARRRGLRTS